MRGHAHLLSDSRGLGSGFTFYVTLDIGLSTNAIHQTEKSQFIPSLPGTRTMRWRQAAATIFPALLSCAPVPPLSSCSGGAH